MKVKMNTYMTRKIKEYKLEFPENWRDYEPLFQHESRKKWYKILSDAIY